MSGCSFTTERLLQEWEQDGRPLLDRLNPLNLDGLRHQYVQERTNPNYVRFHLYCPLCAHSKTDEHHFERALGFLLAAALALSAEQQGDAKQAEGYLAHCLNQVGISNVSGVVPSQLGQISAFHKNLYLVHEVLHYLRKGQWVSAERSVRVGFPLARLLHNDAIAVYVTFELIKPLQGWPPHLFVHPETLLSNCWKKDFAEQFDLLEKVIPLPQGYAVRWKLESFGREGIGWKWQGIGGASVGLAAGVGLKSLHDNKVPSVRHVCTGALRLDDNNQTIVVDGVGSYKQKLDILGKYADVYLVLSEKDLPHVRSNYQGYGDRLIAVKTLDEAIERVCRRLEVLPTDWAVIPQLPQKFYRREGPLRDIEDALRDKNVNFIVLVGAPGVGKSTLLHKVLADLPQIEIRIDKLAYWRWQKPEDVFSGEKSKQIQDSLDKATQHGEYILAVIDGFEHALDAKRKVGAAVRDLVQHYDANPQVRFIVTSSEGFTYTQVTKDASRVREVGVDPPDADTAAQMLNDLLSEKGIKCKSEDVLEAVKVFERNPYYLHVLVDHLSDSSNPSHTLKDILTNQQVASYIVSDLLKDRFCRLQLDQQDTLKALAILGAPAPKHLIRYVAAVRSDLGELLNHLRRKHWLSVTSDGRTERYYLHSIDQAFIKKQISDDKDKGKKMHTRAARYYQRKIDGREKSYRAQPFHVAGFRFEDAQYERYYREWLYHLSHLSPDDAVLEFALHFFEAFDWWGWYLPYAPCQELINRLKTVFRSGWPKDVVDYLDSFHRSYPPRGQPGAKGNWKNVEEQLKQLLRCFNISDTSPPQAKDRRVKLAAFLYNFIGDAYHYQQHPAAETYYRLCVEVSQELGDNEFLAWRRFFLAEHYLEREMYNEASEQCRESLMLAKTGKDFETLEHELLAWVRLRLGEIWEVQGDLQKAKDCYLLASVHAYGFQVYPSRSHPDEYTCTFFGDILGRIQQKQDAVLQHVNAFWRRQISADWPPAPAPGALKDRRQKRQYREEAKRQLEKIQQQIGDILWSV